MDNTRRAGGRMLRRLRLSRGWSWADQAGQLRSLARSLKFGRISAASLPSIQRTIARWENGTTTPAEQYQTLLGCAYARTQDGTVALGPGSDFAELLAALAQMSVDSGRLDELTITVTAALTDTGMSLLAFLAGPLSAELARALARPDNIDESLPDKLVGASRAIDRRIGSVPFVRLHLNQAVLVDACRHLMRHEQPPPVRARLHQASSAIFVLGARLAFETHDDSAAFALYKDAVAACGTDGPSRRALIRTSQVMTTYYASGDTTKARQIASAAVHDARRGDSLLVRARAHAIQAEMAARGNQPRQAHAALHRAHHDLDGDTSGDPQPGAFSSNALHGFEGICGIFLGHEEEAERQLAESAAALTGPRQAVQRAIVLTDKALARLRAGRVDAAEAVAEQLHACVDLTAATRGRVPALRLRQVRLELRPWRNEPFIADLDDHIHTTLIGL